MIISVSKEELTGLLLKEIKAWESVGGGPNLQAFDFDPKTIDKEVLDQLGYYKNRESWIAGVRIKELVQYLKEIQNTTPR
jgi:hypothetical protein